jgi:hypothetical protein
MRRPGDGSPRSGGSPPVTATALLVTVVAAALVGAGAAPASATRPLSAAAPPAVATPVPASPCDALNVLLQPACRLAEQRLRPPDPTSPPVTPLGGVAGGLAGGVVGGVLDTVGDSAMQALTGFVVDGAVWFLQQLAEVITRSTSVSVTAGWFRDRYAVMAEIAAWFGLLFLLLTAGSALFHQDPGRIGRAVVRVAAAGLGTGAALTVTQLLLSISDQLSATVAGSMAGDLRRALTGAAQGLRLSGSLGAGNTGVPQFAVLLGGFVTALAVAVIWIELLLREVAIYAALLFVPIALVWRRWAQRLAELLTALIFAKFVIVAILSLAASGLASGGEGFGGVLAGVALLVVAAFAPFLLLRLATVLEVAVAAGVLEGSRQRGTRPLLYGGQMAFYALQRHRFYSLPRAGGITVAGPAGLVPATGLTTLAHTATAPGRHVAGTTAQTLPQPPPSRAGDPARDHPDDPPHRKGA